ncbi:protein LURP-one-related 12-like [Actinidia eriantha]|uniref:protein LURP-one-related 12-like n=1 Tax=Actinidia eriantha TaxID=165200 RepID=UPI00258464ED|nr:protein LURP-one-related 12-like [Actinidia eriantha]XP_057505182.1 protein LURP-one-related 12-like [Actinidia eriantha]
MKKGGVVVENGFTYEEETHLTVLKTSLFFAGDGFTVYDCKGELVFRVDSYGQDAHDHAELVLMDAYGHCLLTIRRKRPSLHQRWEGFRGERTHGEKPIFSVRRSSMIGRSTVTVEVYGDPGEEYRIKGSFGQRCCMFYDAAKQSVAEIRRKVDASVHVVLDKDVFSLSLKPGFDGAFAMGLVLVLDQINADDDDVDDVSTDVDPLNEDSNMLS